ncbi:putative HTH-type transcriptional regulator KipR [Streptomyces afghaniensis 772]|uniref:Putative HTH-type transcriptional regulator KipR n=1 Tax=Streptomyces afghaniensis 772 TaxID=1283301 RepID=S4N9H1_9ACTN|nr:MULTISPECIES: IclR family transcriptional regulator [Streptomyces]EPJ34369.1 putative HTH-type transcriptional regulator KipR [Streptomyces afghaniensis 772]MDG9713649.1 IclR family transcriptional regulator [Streptomyces sp. DH10]UOB14830.1 IclR family transcriptional regulator [Streptomyces sp. HP-A2021]
MATKAQGGTGEQDGPDRTAPTIQTVQRAALILGSFTVGKPHMSLNEITARLGASKATAHRYTKALRAANLLRYDERTSLYSLGPQVLTLATAARAGLPIVAAAEPYMEELVRRIDETIVLSVWDGESATVVRSVDNTDHMVRISVRVGSRLNLTSSAQGRVFLAFLPPEQVPTLPRSVRKSELNEELEAIRKHGLSVNSPTVNGVRTVAAPIFEGDTISGTLAIVGTTATVSDDVTSPMAQALLETARALSQRLGTSEDAPNGG